MSDKVVLDMSMSDAMKAAPRPFQKKSWVSVLDDSNGSYSSNQSTLTTSALANSAAYANYKEAYLSIPLLLTLSTDPATRATAGGFAPATAGTAADYAIGLKNWFGSVIHGMQVKLNGVDVVQQSNFINLINCFKLLTTLSYNDLVSKSSEIGFYPDNSDSFAYIAVGATNLQGKGVCNNTVVSGATEVNAFNRLRCNRGNTGFLNRIKETNFDLDGDVDAALGGALTYATLVSSDTLNQVQKSYIIRKQNGVNTTSEGQIQVAINAIVYLKHLSDFFNVIPMARGLFFSFTFYLNNSSARFAATATNTTLNSVSVATGGVCPLMLASRVAGEGGANVGTTSYIYNLSVGTTCLDSALSSATPALASSPFDRNIKLHVPLYVFNGEYEKAYREDRVKMFEYEDVFQTSILNVAASSYVSQILTNGIANLKSLLMVPFYSASNSNVSATPIPPYQSIFDSAGGGSVSPFCYVNNYNVKLAGMNVYDSPINYSYEMFVENLKYSGGVNYGLTDGLSSGLISKFDYETLYSYVYSDLTRFNEAETVIPKSVQVQFQNRSTLTCDYIIFLTFGVSMSLDVVSGARV